MQRWRKGLRLRILRRDPICKMCRIMPSRHADHIKPHNDDPDLFWDEKNCQGLCDSCHSIKTRAEEKGEELPPEIGLDGWPVEKEGGRITIPRQGS